MKRSVIVETTVNFVIHSVLVLAVYLLFAGHNQPGGGFVAGLAAGAAISLRYVAGGIDEVRAASPVPPWTVLGVGLAIAAGTALAPLVTGSPVLESGYVVWDLPILGEVEPLSTTLFDSGVFLIVIGLVLMVMEAFGDGPGGGEAAPTPDDPTRSEVRR